MKDKLKKFATTQWSNLKAEVVELFTTDARNRTLVVATFAVGVIVGAVFL